MNGSLNFIIDVVQAYTCNYFVTRLIDLHWYQTASFHPPDTKGLSRIRIYFHIILRIRNRLEVINEFECFYDFDVYQI